MTEDPGPAKHTPPRAAAHEYLFRVCAGFCDEGRGTQASPYRSPKSGTGALGGGGGKHSSLNMAPLSANALPIASQSHFAKEGARTPPAAQSIKKTRLARSALRHWARPAGRTRRRRALTSSRAHDTRHSTPHTYTRRGQGRGRRDSQVAVREGKVLWPTPFRSA